MANNLPDNVSMGDVDDAAAGRYGDETGDPCNYRVKVGLTGWGYAYVTASSEDEAMAMVAKGQYQDYDAEEWEVGDALAVEPNPFYNQ